MIVTGFGKASRVTFSYNDFDGRTPYSGTCNGAHYWGLLLLGAADTLTFYGNWLHDISGRGPHAGGLMNATNSVQLVNNYFQRFPGHELEAYTDKTHLLLEGNQFEKVDQLMDPSATGGHVMFPVGSPSELCQGALGRACVPNAIVPSASSKLPLDAAALGQLGKDALPSIVAPYDAGKVSRSVRHLAGPLL
jgi:pectin lyase